ncbi:MAG: hypothetical protein DRR08_16370 [Candidatus Parabeggiatoa sp. nov. 2]|nr:MAG: hypothetical protein B6247_06065 [Beggiatoa sp. 4572_84]RKZ58471.1 MAG: hypothetical protein DRR08_16370 [Gammaproteobacteria bacterium]HEC83619.1 hypothetical protein [Thioploca sp.]
MKTDSQLKTIQARGYRNIEMPHPFELDNLNIMIGANGAGKSNLLEMIEFLPDALWQSPRSPNFSLAVSR